MGAPEYSWFKNDLPIYLSGASFAMSVFAIVWSSKVSSRASAIDAGHHEFSSKIADPILANIKSLKDARNTLASFQLLPDDEGKIRDNITSLYREIVKAQDDLIENLEKSDRSRFSSRTDIKRMVENPTENVLKLLDRILNPQATSSSDELKTLISNATSLLIDIETLVNEFLEKETFDRYNLSVWPFGNPLKYFRSAT